MTILHPADYIIWFYRSSKLPGSEPGVKRLPIAVEL